jgi:MYXO-CTERM domain-containing protein
MGIQVWMLGPGRAIPRNYYHTVINDAKIDWLGYGKNYNDVIIAATKEAEGRHTFVTEFAGSSSRMQGLLNGSGRFGNQTDLAAQTTDIAFVGYMLQHSYPLTAQTVAVLQKYIPVPAIPNITPAQFYSNISYYLGTSYRAQNPSQFTGWTENFQPAMMAQDLQDRVVGPTLAAGALFDQQPYLTRLYTTLSPENMNKDPVFSFNVGLPDYSNAHNATLTYHCNLLGTNDNQSTTPATLVTESGWAIDFPGGTGSLGGTYRAPAGPSSQRIEILREQGAPEVVTDNTSRISNALDAGGGCGVGVGGGRASRNVVGAIGLVALAALMKMRRKRAR